VTGSVQPSAGRAVARGALLRAAPAAPVAVDAPPALLMISVGTTGTPKTIMLPQARALSAHEPDGGDGQLRQPPEIRDFTD